MTNKKIKILINVIMYLYLYMYTLTIIITILNYDISMQFVTMYFNNTIVSI